MKVALVSSHGGHLTELEYLVPALGCSEVVWITYDSERTRAMPRTYLLDNIGLNVWRMIATFPKAWRILRRERPDVVMSTGAEVAIPFFVLAKVLRARTVFVESWTRVNMPTKTGRIVYPLSDLFLVQWEESLANYGPKARFVGSIV